MATKFPRMRDFPADRRVEERLRELFAPVEQEPIPQEWLDMLKSLKESDDAAERRSG